MKRMVHTGRILSLVVFKNIFFLTDWAGLDAALLFFPKKAYDLTFGNHKKFLKVLDI